MKKIYVFMILVLFAFSAEAKMLYVDGATGNDSVTYTNNSENNPWETIGRAAWGSTNRSQPNSGEAARAGDTVYISAGIYDTSTCTGHRQQPVYAPVNSGSPGNYITFQAQGTVRLTSSCVTGIGEPIIGSKSGQEYIKFDGFTMRQAEMNFQDGGGVVNIWGSHITISNCDIEGVYTEYQYDDQHNAIFVGGYLPRASGIVIENNKLHGFTGGSSMNDSAIALYHATDIEIRNNEIYSNTTGMYLKVNLGNGINVHHNLIHSNVGSGIVMKAVGGGDIYQNIIRDNRVGVDFFGSTNFIPASSGPQNVRVVNNIIDNNVTGVYFNAPCNTMSTNLFKNNIVTGGTNVHYAECNSATEMYPATIDHDYNILYGFSSVFGNYNGNATPINFSFANWQSGTFNSQGANSLASTDPLYANSGSDDFRLCTASGVPHGSCSGASLVVNYGIDILDLNNDGSTTDSVNLGAYLTGDETIGVTSASNSTTRPLPPNNIQAIGTP